jgi:hypothetical protein
MNVLRNALGKAAPALAGVFTGAILVAFALPALARDDPPRSFASGATAPHVSSVKGFTSKSSGLKVRYFATKSTVQPSAEDGGALKCPKKYHAISGFFGPSAQEGVGQLALTDSFPEGSGNRRWDIGVKNLSATPLEYFQGIVCVK